MKSIVKKIGRKSVFWLCLTVSLIIGGVINLLAKVELDCFDHYINDQGEVCWIVATGCQYCEYTDEHVWFFLCHSISYPLCSGN